MKVGITTRLDLIETTKEVRASIDINWINFLRPLATSLSILQTGNSNLLPSVEGLDLVIFTGGNDLFSINPCDLSKKRDLVEFRLLENCIEYDIPVLGVCRGMQLIHAFYGGALCSVTNHVAKIHQLEICSDWLSSIDQVNSFHNWGLVSNSLSENFDISAKCLSDNSVEAISHKDLRVRGIMWHPERWDKNLGDPQSYYEKQLNLLEFAR